MTPLTETPGGRLLFSAILAAICIGCGCGGAPPDAVEKRIPRGYAAKLEIQYKGRVLRFGPFVGYYFAPFDPSDLTRLRFVCLNERQFYTRDLPANSRLFEGEAVLRVLPDTDMDMPFSARINPVFVDRIPEAWLATRPSPRAEFRHFHSCYDAVGPVRTGYWLRHVAVNAFTYDMGGRVGPESPLYHQAEKGPDRRFAFVVEFDKGPKR